MKMDPNDLFYCDKCKYRLIRIMIDGKHSGDNLMEGIRFLFITRPDRPACVGVHDDDKEYFKKFNYGYWVNLMNNIANIEEYGQCPRCGKDIPIWGMNNPKKKEQSIQKNKPKKEKLSKGVKN